MSEATCSAAGITGLVSYLFTKLLIFAFLLERGEYSPVPLFLRFPLITPAVQSTSSGIFDLFLGATLRPTASPHSPSWPSAPSSAILSPHSITSSDPTPASAPARASPVTSASTIPLALPSSWPPPAPSPPFSSSSSSSHYLRLSSSAQGQSPRRVASPAPPVCAPRRSCSAYCCGMEDGSVHSYGSGLVELMVSLTCIAAELEGSRTKAEEPRSHRRSYEERLADASVPPTVLLNAILVYSITSSTTSASSFDLETGFPPPTPYPDYASPRSQFSKSSFGSPRPSMTRAHSLDHFTFSQAAPSPPKVAFLLNRPLRGLSEDLVVEFDGEDGDEGKTSSNSLTSITFMDKLHSNYTPSPSTSYGNISPPSQPPQSPKGSTFGI